MVAALQLVQRIGYRLQFSFELGKTLQQFVLPPARVFEKSPLCTVSDKLRTIEVQPRNVKDPCVTQSSEGARLLARRDAPSDRR